MNRKPFRIAYAVQNVGGIDFRQDIGDTVPAKQTILGLQRFGHQVTCYKLEGSKVIGYHDLRDLTKASTIPVGVSDWKLFRWLERGIRRIQKTAGLPYFAAFDTFRFYEASLRFLPGSTLCHEHNGLFCLGAALACKKLRIPYVLTFSSDPLFERRVVGKPLRGLHYQAAALEAQFTYKLARRIICVSNQAKEHLVQSWGVDPEKVAVMPNGVDTGLFKPVRDALAVRAKLGLGENPVVCFAGGFQPWHGLDVLIESFARILPDFPDAKLLLIGDGRARPLVDQKIEEFGIGNSVIITGFVPQVQMPELLGAADVSVLPYPKLPKDLWFSPLKLYEYMAAGKAIVASRSGQIAEVILHDQNGILVEPGNVEELSAAISDLLKDPVRRASLGMYARRQALERHSWDQYIARLEKIYEETLSIEIESSSVAVEV